MMNELVKQEWVDKYRPKTLDDYVLNDDLKTYFKQMIANKTLQNCTFGGICGMGKTTLAKILCNEFNAEVLFVKCATEGTIDILRTKVEPFCNAMSLDNKIKICILDELDSASQTGQNNFQLGLRTLIEAAQDDTRFICTANTVNKIVPAVLSRCPLIPLKFEKKDLLVHLKKILDTEKIEYEKDNLRAFVEESFKYYPDCRRIINYLQFCCNSGKLVVKLNDVANEEMNTLVDDLLAKVKSSSKIMDIRSFYLQQKQKITDYKVVGAELVDKAIDRKLLDDPRAILKASDIMYQMNLVVNPEIQFFALVCLLFGVCHA